MLADFQRFGLPHFAIMAAIPATAAVLGTWMRHRPDRARTVRLFLAIALTANELAWWAFRYSIEGVRASSNLPLQLSDLCFWMAVIALFTCSQWAYDFAYYIGLPTAVMAVVTPDLWAGSASYGSISFFVAHGGIIVAVLLLTWSGLMRPRPPTLRRTLAPLAAWSALAGAADVLFGANYMYLREKPESASILNWFGPWPIYIAATGVLAFAVFKLMWLPFRESACEPHERSLKL